MKLQNTRLDRIFWRIKKNPAATSIIVSGTILITLVTISESVSLIQKNRPKAAHIELKRLSLEYTPEAFVETARKCDLHAIKLFLTAGINPNAKDDKGRTALMYAARSCTPMSKLLLKAKAGINEKSNNGWTALDWAAAGDDENNLRLLIESGANAEAINNAFITAAKCGRIDNLPILLDSGVRLNEVGAEALRQAAGSSIVRVNDKGQSEVVGFLLELGVDVNAKNEHGWTALHLAVKSKHIAVVDTLLERGAEINIKCECRGYLGLYGDMTALSIALESGYDEVVAFLFEKGASLNMVPEK